MPPDRPSTTCSKPFLRDVVAHAEHERGVDLGVDVEQRSATGPPTSPAWRAGRRAAQRPEVVDVRPAPRAAGRRWRVSRSRAAPAASVSTSQTSSVLGELRRAGDDLAVVVDDERVAVEDELVLAADERAEGHRARACRGRAARPSARGRGPCRGGRARPTMFTMSRRAGQRLVGQRRPRLPDVLADRSARPARRRPRRAPAPGPGWK